MSEKKWEKKKNNEMKIKRHSVNIGTYAGIWKKKMMILGRSFRIEV